MKAKLKFKLELNETTKEQARDLKIDFIKGQTEFEIDKHIQIPSKNESVTLNDKDYIVTETKYEIDEEYKIIIMIRPPRNKWSRIDEIDDVFSLNLS